MPTLENKTILVKHDEHVDDVLEGLSQEHALVIFVIESKFETPPIIKVEALLLACECVGFKIKFSLLQETTLSPMEIQPLQVCKIVATIFMEISATLYFFDHGGHSGGRFASFSMLDLYLIWTHY